ncbi:DNA cytosine methyltransferase [Amycolatopsis sp. NPDC026612]|uniref:DNA cytosine methyltransferase n=1 Tax=Amycolatopsis sp. NPDC026612 TaxID=3155466 RepID=UPI0033F9DC97
MRLGSTRPIVVDVFAGAGGLSLGFEQAGFDVVAAIEYDPTHAMVHKYNFPDTEILCRDVRGITAADVYAAASRGASRMRAVRTTLDTIDVLIGGPSCQGFSSMGRRQDDDERNDLLMHFSRLVCEVRPRAFVLENVPGLLEPRFADFRNSVFKKLRNAGYHLTGTDKWVDASDFGVPQVRKRVLVFGSLESEIPELLPTPTVRKMTVRDAFDGLPEIEAYDDLLKTDSAALNAEDVRRRIGTTSAYAANLADISAVENLGRPRLWDHELLTNSLRTVHTPEIIKRFASTQPGSVEAISRFYRLSLDSPSRTLRAGTGRERGAHTSPRPIHPTLPRVITVREAARLHGYPDWFRMSGTNWHGHRQIGNSVPPPLAKAAGDLVIRSLGHRPRRLKAKRPLGDSLWLYVRPDEAANLVDARTAELPPMRIRKESKKKMAAQH